MGLRDDRLPAAGVLLGDRARDLVDAALAERGGRVVRLQRRQVVYRPSRSLTVRYAADVSWDGAPPHHDTLVAVADRRGPWPGTLVAGHGGVEVGLFRYPDDPRLPGLRTATTPAVAAAALGWRTPPALVARTYRPGDRAVVRARSTEIGERYLKVLRPAQVPALVERLRALADVAPVAPVRGVRADLGLVVLDAIPGTTLRDALRAGADEVPEADAVLAALAAATSVPLGELSVVRAPTERAEGHARVLAAVLPSSRKRIGRLLDRLAGDVAAPASVVHGDLHPAQVVVEGASLRGLLDFDGVGWGRPVDDLATFLGHLANLSLTDRSGAVRAYLERTCRAFEEVVDPTELHRQTAAVLLGLATGPHRTQQAGWRATTLRRLALAERWAAGRVRTRRTAA